MNKLVIYMACFLRILALFIVIGCISYHSCFAQESQEMKKLPVPAGLEKLYFGMPLKELLDYRINVTRGLTSEQKKEFLSDDKVRDVAKDKEPGIDLMLTEIFGANELYSFALYFFKDSKLNAINVGNIYSDDVWRSKLQENLQEAIKKYGIPTQIGISTLNTKGEKVRVPVLIWKKGQAAIIVRFTQADEISKQKNHNVFDLQIGSDSWVSIKDMHKALLTIEAAEYSKTIIPLLELFKKIVPVTKDIEVIRDPSKIYGLREIKHIRINSQDFSPEWGRENNSVFYFTTRRIQGDTATSPKSLDEVVKAGPPEQFKIAKFGNNTSTAYFKLTSISGLPAFSPSSQRLAFTHDDAVYIFDLNSHDLGRVNDGERVFRRMPAWDRAGEHLAMSGIHSPSDRTEKTYRYDDDIFVSSISKKLTISSANKTWCPARMPGQDILPIFDLSGQWIYFVNQTIQVNSESKQENKEEWTIFKVKADKHFTQNTPAEKIAVIGGMPDRISWFPDGKRLLISYAANNVDLKSKEEIRNPPIVLDVDAKSIEPLNLPVVYDKDFMGSNPLLPKEMLLSPDATKIVFSSLVWPRTQESAFICIYTCKLDGTELERISTLPPNPLKPFQYAKQGVSAINAWNLLSPRHNSGTPVDLEATANVDGKPAK